MAHPAVAYAARMIGRTLSSFGAVAMTLVGSLAVGQSLRAPTFYLSSAPALTVGGQVRGALTSASGQNFKDGSRVEVVVARLDAGERVTIEVRAPDFDAFLTVYAPTGDVVAAVDDGPSSLDPIASFTPATAGTYLLVVSGFGPYDLGPFTVTATASRPAEPTSVAPGQVVRGVLSDTAPHDPRVGLGPSTAFDVELDSAALLWVEVASLDFDTVVTVFDGTTWLGENDDAGGTSDSVLALELPAGRYTIVVSSWDGTGGTFDLSVRRFVALD